MTTPDNLVVIYKELADWHERQGQPQTRDRFLVLAADAALSAGRGAEADLLLLRLLRVNPHHMLRPFASFGEAMASPDIRNYVAELRRTYPPEKAEGLFDAHRASRTNPEKPAIPQTAPVVDLDDERPGGREPLKVFRVPDEADAPKAPAPRPARPTAAHPPPAPPRPVPPRPARPAPPPAEPEPPPPPPPTDGEDAPAGQWVSVSLFVALLAAGVALAGYTFLGPLLRG